MTNSVDGTLKTLFHVIELAVAALAALALLFA
jgi:hypothetical protein